MSRRQHNDNPVGYFNSGWYCWSNPCCDFLAEEVREANATHTNAKHIGI